VGEGEGEEVGQRQRQGQEQRRAEVVCPAVYAEYSPHTTTAAKYVSMTPGGCYAVVVVIATVTVLTAYWGYALYVANRERRSVEHSGQRYLN
jgi:hypothetical protein